MSQYIRSTENGHQQSQKTNDHPSTSNKLTLLNSTDNNKLIDIQIMDPPPFIYKKNTTQLS